VARFVALLRAVNVGRRRVDMATARTVLSDLGYTSVESFVNSGNLLFDADDDSDSLESTIRGALEERFGFELTTFVRTADEIRAIVAARPFGTIPDHHTHFMLFPLTRMTPAEKAAVVAMSNDHDQLVVQDRDVHWLIRSKSTETTLGAKQWRDALPTNPTTARNITMLNRLAARM
jgi:uncharacterized protein (DUF1697 family)